MRARRGTRHHGRDTLTLPARYQRAHLHAGLLLRTDLDGTHRARQVGDQPLVNALARVQAAGGGAVLAGVVKSEGAHTGDHRFDVRVIEHDDRRLATEFQVCAFEVAGGRRQHFLSGCHRAGQRHHAHAVVSYERAAHWFAATADDVDHPGRQDLSERHRQLQRGERRQLRGLEDQGIAGGDRRCDLPGRHHQRIVPRRNRADDADRIAADHAGVTRQVLPRCQPLGRAAGPGEEAEHIGDRGHFVIERRGQGLAGVARFELGISARLGVDMVGDTQQQRRAIPGSRARPARKCRFCRHDGRVDLRHRGFRHRGDLRTTGGVVHRLRLRLARDQASADQHLRLHAALLVCWRPACRRLPARYIIIRIILPAVRA